MKQVLVSIALIISLSSFSQNASKPNVIIIYFDDMGYGDIEPFGMTGVHTPNFNRLAAEGLRLTNFNTVQAVCTASRAAILTGAYPNRIGLAGAFLPGAKTALHPDEQTIASLLKDNGYKTAMLGKWHLGNRPPYFPMNFGFDSFYGLPYSHDIWPIDYAGKLITDPANWRGTWPPLPVIEGDNEIESITTLGQQAQWTPTLTEKAVTYIKANKKNPFFLYLAHPMPHVPLAVSEKFKGKSELGLFGDVMMELDWSVGEVLKVLDKENLAKNTILIVTSDNGPWLNFGDHAGSGGGFKEGKGTGFEGGTRVPFLIRWPEKIKAGYVTGELMTNMDVLPTISAMTGSALPKKKIDGLNFMPRLLSKTEKGPREFFYYYYDQNSLKAVRYKHWKLVLPHTSASYEFEKPGKDGFPGKIGQIKVKQALYDLARDPGERIDLQELYPEIVAEIMKLVEAAREDLGDDLTQREGKNRRKAAVVE